MYKLKERRTGKLKPSLLVKSSDVRPWVVRKSSREGKKYMVTSPDGKVIHFGAAGYSDFTKHKNKDRRTRYLARHIANENWLDPYSAGFWARYLLWNKPTLKDSARAINKEFGIVVTIVTQ